MIRWIEPSYSGWRLALTALAISGFFPQTIIGVAADMVMWSEWTKSFLVSADDKC